MPDTPPFALTQPQRRRLLTLLARVILFDTPPGRDRLLDGLPAPFKDGISRNAIKTVDLAAIVQAALDWGLLSDGTPALLAVLDNACFHSGESQPGTELAALRQELTASSAPPLAAPITAPAPKRRPPRLTPVQRTELFKEVKKAVTERRWQRALELSQRIRRDRGVPELLYQANRGWAEEQMQLRALRNAYADDDWEQVLLAAQHLGPDGLEEVGAWIAEAKQELAAVQQHQAAVNPPLTSAPITVTPPALRRAAGYESLTNAYHAQDWVQVIQLARQVGSVSPEMVDWVADAWRALTVAEKILPGHTDVVNAVAVTSDGRYALSGSADGTLRVWDLHTGTYLRAFDADTVADHSAVVWTVAVTPDSRYAFSGSEDNILRLWDVATGKCVRRFAGHTAGVNAVAVTPDGSHVLSGSADTMLKLWNLAGDCLQTFAGHTFVVQAVAVTPDGRYAISGSNDKTVRLWDIATGKCLRIFTDHDSAVGAVAVTPDGYAALSGSDDNTMRLWNLATGKVLRTFTGHTHLVEAVTVTPNGRYILSGSADRTLKLWDLATSQCLRTFTGDSSPGRTVAITPDGQSILAGNTDHTLRIWTLPAPLLA